MRGVVDWLESLPRERAPSVVLILHFTAFPSPEKNDGTVDMYREAFERIERSPLRHGFVLMADSMALIDEYSSISALNFVLAPIPHVARAPVETAKPPRWSNDPIVLSYLGEARHNKGFHLLPAMIRGIRDSELSSRVSFHLQTFCHDPTEFFYPAAMGKIDPHDAILIPDELDEAGYQGMMEQADVILAPYLLENYHRQTSGIFAEALALGKPTVVSRGTWMARELNRYGGGRACVPNDPRDFLDVCMSVVRDFDDLRVEAQTAARAWNRFHNPERLAEIMIEATGVTP
jgi:glycosyltransferase involved in cell wall biosynthesis